jgi:hypothetical protein
MRSTRRRSIGTGTGGLATLRVLIVMATVLLLGLAEATATTITVNFETRPPLPLQPNNFAAAGAMQTYSSAGVFTISGGVVLGNPTFLPAFPLHGSVPNLYGTTDVADPSLLSTITLDLPVAAGTTSIGGVLFNGQPIAEDYEVDFFSGGGLLAAQAFTGVEADTSANAFRSFSFSSNSANPITRVTITTPNAGLNGWDFFVDTLVLTQASVPAPSALVLVVSGAAWLAYRGARRRKDH